MIVRLEQVFTGFRQLLPPRSEPRGPLKVAAFDAMSDYRAFLGRFGIQIDNPACFVPSENFIAAGSNVRQFAAELARVKAQHAEIEATLKDLRRDLPDRLAALAEQMKADGVAPDLIAKTLHNEGRKVQGRYRPQGGRTAQGQPRERTAVPGGNRADARASVPRGLSWIPGELRLSAR